MLNQKAKTSVLKTYEIEVPLRFCFSKTNQRGPFTYELYFVVDIENFAPCPAARWRLMGDHKGL